MITTFYPPYNFGGDGIFIYRLSNELAKRGHQVDVIHCIDAYHILARKEPSGTYPNHPNITVHRLKSRFGFLSPLATQQTGFPFFKSARIRQILERGFDVIHYHNISLVGGPKILEYGNGIKLYTMHEYWLVCPNHGLVRFKKSPCTRRYCFLCSLIFKRPPQWWRYVGLLKKSVRHVDAFIAPSRFTKNTIHRMGLNIPIIHLPNFVPSEEVPEEQFDCKVIEKPYFLFVGRLEKGKGLHTIIPVFHHYQKAQLLIAGTGRYEPRLRELARGNTNIQFLGQLSSAKLQPLYQQAVALIVPSRSYEVFPLVLIEAFREKTPVIARNLGVMPEIIEESGGGFVYDREDELVAKMDQLVANPPYRNELGLRGYYAYKQKWTVDVHLKHYFELIHEIVTTHGQPVSTLTKP
jgi:glycosyltransferase involved in cell wall biosynthesis